MPTCGKLPNLPNAHIKKCTYVKRCRLEQSCHFFRWLKIWYNCKTKDQWLFCEGQVKDGRVPKQFVFKFIWMTAHMGLAISFLPKLKYLPFWILILSSYNHLIVCKGRRVCGMCSKGQKSRSRNRLYWAGYAWQDGSVDQGQDGLFNKRCWDNWVSSGPSSAPKTTIDLNQSFADLHCILPKICPSPNCLLLDFSGVQEGRREREKGERNPFEGHIPPHFFCQPHVQEIWSRGCSGS